MRGEDHAEHARPSSSSTRTTRPARSIPTSVLREIVEIARQHDLILFADEIYDKMLYDGHTHTAIASLADDVLFLTFNGLSKNYRSCGYRAGWMVVSGEKRHAARLHRGPQHAGVDAPVRQHAGPARDPDRARRLPEHQRPGRAGRPPVPPARPGAPAADRDSRASAASSRRRRCTCSRSSTRRSTRSRTTSSSPRAAAEQKVLVVQGTGFNWPTPDHFRIVFLPNADDLTEAIGRIARFLEHYRKRHSHVESFRTAARHETDPGRPARHRHRRQRHLRGAASQPGGNPAPRRPRHPASRWSPTSTPRAPARIVGDARRGRRRRARGDRATRRSTSWSS